MLLSKGKNPAIILLHVFIIIFLIGFSSCKPGRKLETGEARIKGRIVNPTRNFIEFKKTTDPAAKYDTIKLNDGGEFEIISKPDTLASYSFVYGVETKSDTLSSDVKSKNLIFSNKTQQLSILLDKEFDIKLWVDTRDPSASLSISGNGADLNNYVTRKFMLNSEFNQKNVNLLKSDPEEYSRFMKEYKAGLDKLLSGLPAKSPYIPEGFRELEAKNIYLTFNTLKLNYAIEHLAEDGNASQFTPDETYFAFLKEIPFDNPEELKNPHYMLLVSTYADYLSKKENLGKTLTLEQWLSAKYETYKKIFADPATLDRVLFDFLKKNSKQFEMEWYKNAVEEFRSTSSSDSLKVELTKLNDKRERLSKGNTAPDFIYPDEKGKEHSLSDYNARYVYVNVWASWCKPCMYEVTFIKQLEEEYKDRNIEFIGISIDEDLEKWKQTLAEIQLPGIQLFAESSEAKIMKDYVIGSIPRSIFIGPGGEMILEDAPRPSSIETRELFNSFQGL